MLRWVVARGTALFLGGFALANAIGVAFGGIGQDSWWLDLWFLERPAAVLLSLLGALALIAFAVSPPATARSRRLVSGVVTMLALAAAFNVVGFYRAWSDGAIEPGLSVPLSVVIGVALAGIAYLAAFGEAPEHTRALTRGIIGWVMVLAIAFPLAQVAFFGTTSYRRPAQAAVVLGAKVHANGALSQSLKDRVDCAIGLHRSGQVGLLVMSGGVGASGVDEALAMKAYAVSAGVPEGDIVCDSAGMDTDSTVRNTCALLGQRGATRVIVVSQFYHLPRIKLAYGAEGMNVYTVPAPPQRPIPKTPYFVAREIPGFWVYWLRALGRDIGVVSPSV